MLYYGQRSKCADLLNSYIFSTSLSVFLIIRIRIEFSIQIISASRSALRPFHFCSAILCSRLLLCGRIHGLLWSMILIRLLRHIIPAVRGAVLSLSVRITGSAILSIAAVHISGSIRTVSAARVFIPTDISHTVRFHILSAIARVILYKRFPSESIQASRIWSAKHCVKLRKGCIHIRLDEEGSDTAEQGS